MALLEISIFASNPAYDFEIELDGVLYTMRMRWNARQALWHLGIDQLEVPLVMLPLYVNNWLLAQHRTRTPAIPPGELQLYSPTGVEAQFDDLGFNSKLLYAPAVDVAAYTLNQVTFTQ